MSRRQNSNIPWWLIPLGFMIFPPLGFLFLFLSIAGVQIPDSKSNRTNTTTQNRQYTNTSRTSSGTYTEPDGSTVTFQHGTSSGSTYRYSYGQAASGQSGKQSASAQEKQTSQAKQPKRGLRRFFKEPKSGKALTVVGSIMSFVFGLGFVEEFLNWGLSFPDEWIPLLGFLCAGLFFVFKGVSKTKLSKRAKLYQAVIGQRNSIFISDLAATAGVSEKKVLSDLQEMLSNGTLPSGYIDKASNRLVLTDQGYVPPEAEPAPKAKAQPKTNTASQPKEDPDDALLRQIREVNDAIKDEQMSRKIDRIEEITRKILAYQKKNPAKAGELRQFLNYYLPTTLKILSAYGQMEAQGIEGENISAAKARIESMMDKVVEGFEKQLDQLFKTDAMDIATDVEVLERMLDKDGLGSGMTMGG